jgi:hypothetical protein
MATIPSSTDQIRPRRPPHDRSSSSPQVEDVPVKAVILGEAYIKRGLKAGKPDRFVCPIGETGKARLMSGSDFLFNPRSHFASWAIGKIFQL